MIKSPKIYFGDTALSSYLMGIHQPEVLIQGSYWGPLFETAVYLERLKWAGVASDFPEMTYFRSKEGLEIQRIFSFDKGFDRVPGIRRYPA